MAHRSVPPPDVDGDVDPFWHDAMQRRPPLIDRARELLVPLRSWVVVAIGVLGVAGAGWWLLRPSSAPIETALPAAEAPSAVAGGAAAGGGAPTTAAPTSTTAADLVVQAAGAIADPGVYDLPVGARVDDLVEAAGGFADGADIDRVNLAAPVGDGERVWIPKVGEQRAPEVVAGTGGGAVAPDGPASGSTGGAGGAAGAADPSNPVDLNTATAEQLDSLPGVGPATASAILAYRDEHGRFGSVEELLEVRGIGDAKLEQLRPLVRV